ncbi:MAG: ATP-binding cassette domain-containing protein [Rubrivivax sp.]|nr:ATP-binding cassette domain-containing protein [Rubrivivax sp.]
MASAAVLQAENLHKRFGHRGVLNGVGLSAREGDVIALIGASGSGKSTLLRCLNLLEQPDEGRLAIAGETLELRRNRQGTLGAASPSQLQRLRTRVAMVFQQFNLWAHMTALENVMEAPLHVLRLPRAEALARAQDCLARVGVAHRMNAYPAHLSGGEQQRVAIARALAMQPQVLLFDEPTSALDPERVAEVLRVMRSLAEEKRTMIVVTHEMGFARDVGSEVVFLHEGRIEEQGAPAELLRHPRSERLRGFLAQALAH